MDPQYTGKKIADLRKSQGRTQKDIAEKLHVSVAAVSKWERGLNFPDISLMEPLSGLLGISVSELLGLENESADKIIADMAQISVIEKKNDSKNILRKILILICAVAVFVLLSCGIYFLWHNDNAVKLLLSFGNTGYFNIAALLTGFAAWGLGIAAITVKEKWRLCTFLSFICCCFALYAPVLITDIIMRSDGWGTVEDTVFAYNFASAVLLTGTVIFNAFAWYRKNDYLLS